MTIRIASERTCDLPQAVVDQYGIGIFPCYINVGNASYLDVLTFPTSIFINDFQIIFRTRKLQRPGRDIFRDLPAPGR